MKKQIGHRTFTENIGLKEKKGLIRGTKAWVIKCYDLSGVTQQGRDILLVVLVFTIPVSVLALIKLTITHFTNICLNISQLVVAQWKTKRSRINAFQKVFL